MVCLDKAMLAVLLLAVAILRLVLVAEVVQLAQEDRALWMELVDVAV
jgi:hypothetical protein